MTMEESMGRVARRIADYRNLRVMRTTGACTTDKDQNVTSLAVKWTTAQCAGD